MNLTERGIAFNPDCAVFLHLQGHAKVTMQNIFKIHEKLNMNRLIHFEQQIYLNHKLIEQKQLNISEILNRAAEFLVQFSGVKDVYSSQPVSYTHLNNFGSRYHTIPNSDIRKI